MAKKNNQNNQQVYRSLDDGRIVAGNKCPPGFVYVGAVGEVAAYNASRTQWDQYQADTQKRKR